MSAIVTYANGTVDREVAQRTYAHSVTAAQDTANVAAVDIGLGATATVVVTSCQIRSTANVLRSPQGAVTVSGSTVTVADSGLAVNEVILISAVAYAA